MHRLLSLTILLLFVLFPSTCFSSDYNRSDWGGWADLDNDGLNTRQEVLHDYSVIGIQCQYTKIVVPAGEIDIDHIIPIRYAWGVGADSWVKEKMVQFYNDPENLVPSLAGVNRAKGAKGPDEWLPKYDVPEYIDKWKRLCVKYELSCNFELLDILADKTN